MYGLVDSVVFKGDGDKVDHVFFDEYPFVVANGEPIDQGNFSLAVF